MSHWCSLCPGVLTCNFCQYERGIGGPMAKRLRSSLGENDYICKDCKEELEEIKEHVEVAEAQNMDMKRTLDDYEEGKNEKLIRSRCLELEFVYSIVVSNVKNAVKDLSFLKQLSDNDVFKDITFVFNPPQPEDSATVRSPFRLHAHRFILAGKSDVFRAMFTSSISDGKPLEIIVLDTSFSTMQALVNYCYTADIRFSDTVLPQEVFKQAYKYNLERLKEVCETQLLIHLTEERLTEMLRFSQIYGTKRLQVASLKFLENNFHDIAAGFLDDVYDDALDGFGMPGA